MADHKFQSQKIKINQNYQIYCHISEKSQERCPILFIHGHRADAMRFKSVLDLLADYGQVYAPDLPGCGKSPRLKNKSHNIQEISLILIQMIEKLELKNIILVGGSLGGMISLQMYPQIKSRIEKLILLVTPVDYQVFKDKYLTYRRFFSPAFRLMIKTRIIPKTINKFIQYDRIMIPLMKRKMPDISSEKETLQYEVAQWRKMEFLSWMEITYSIFNTQLKNDLPFIECPTMIVESKKNQYYSVDKNLERLKTVAPKNQIEFLPWEMHVPRGEIKPSQMEPYRRIIEPFIQSSQQTSI